MSCPKLTLSRLRRHRACRSIGDSQNRKLLARDFLQERMFFWLFHHRELGQLGFVGIDVVSEKIFRRFGRLPRKKFLLPKPSNYWTLFSGG